MVLCSLGKTDGKASIHTTMIKRRIKLRSHPEHSSLWRKLESAPSDHPSLHLKQAYASSALGYGIPGILETDLRVSDINHMRTHESLYGQVIFFFPGKMVPRVAVNVI